MIKPGTVRFILAMIVVVFHITKFIFIGTFAVLVFFILSGYWISVMYDAKYSKLPSPVSTFYVSRLWRLFPVYLLVALAAVGIHWWFHTPSITYLQQADATHGIEYVLSSITLLGYNLLPNKLLISAWSLDIELQFYFLFPLIYAVMTQNAAGKYVVLGMALLLQVVLSLYHLNAVISSTVLYYLLYFVIGITIHLNRVQFAYKTELLFNVLFVLTLVVNYVYAPFRYLNLSVSGSTYNIYLNQLLPFLIIPLLSNSVQQKGDARDKSLGDVSYEIYLIHAALIIPYSRYAGFQSFTKKAPYALLFIGATVVLGYLIYTYYDKPIDSLRRKWIKKRETGRQQLSN